MKKNKAKCHICANTMKTPQDQQQPAFCDTCGANLVNPNDETVVLFTCVEKEAGGITGELVNIYLTTKRLIFTPDTSGGGTAGAVGGAVGGLVGAAVGAAIGAAVNSGKCKPLVSVPRADFASFDEAPAGLLKNKIRLTVNTQSGCAFGMTLSKKEAAKWKAAMSQRAM